MSLNSKDSEIMSPPCTSRPCIWSKICQLLSLSKGVLTKTAANKTSSFLQSYCCCPSSPHSLTWARDPHTSLSWVQGKLKRGLLSGVRDIPADQIRLQWPCGVSDCSPGSLHANQQQEITTNSIRFPLMLYQCKWLNSFYRASLFSIGCQRDSHSLPLTFKTRIKNQDDFCPYLFPQMHKLHFYKTNSFILKQDLKLFHDVWCVKRKASTCSAVTFVHRKHVSTQKRIN